ncbi:hypothetical protein LXL04_017711 [Taraxacum kok-saghyz]
MKSGSGKRPQVRTKISLPANFFTFLNRHLENPIDASITTEIMIINVCQSENDLQSVSPFLSQSQNRNWLLPLFLNLKNDSLSLKIENRLHLFLSSAALVSALEPFSHTKLAARSFPQKIDFICSAVPIV